MPDDETISPLRQKFARRSVMTGAIAGCAFPILPGCIPHYAPYETRVSGGLRLIEAGGNGTLGVSILNTGTNTATAYKGYARFPHCSSFKLSLAAMILHLVDEGMIDGEKTLHWKQADMLAHSPFTAQHIDTGAKVIQLAEAAQILSDNTAANLLLRETGGPQALTAFWRRIGDMKSRLDRTEPELNAVAIGDVQDTTTPDAMAQTVATLLYGPVLSEKSRSILKQWMVQTATGKDRVRGGLPGTWISGDKTGTSLWPGIRSMYVDIGFIEPPDHPPVTFAAYFRANAAHRRIDPAAKAVLSDLGRFIAQKVIAENSA